MGVGLRVRKTSQLSCRGKGVWLLGVNQSACVRSDVVTLFRSSTGIVSAFAAWGLLPRAVGRVWPLGLGGRQRWEGGYVPSGLAPALAEARLATCVVDSVSIKKYTYLLN